MTKYKVLIVEDDTDINNLLKKILKAAGYEIEQAFSGTEAEFYFDKNMPDLLLLDLMLPGMSGEELLRQIREKRKCNIPVLVLSAKNALKDKVELLGIGADDYITKPFEPEEIVARVQAALRRSGLAAKAETMPEVLVYKNINLYPNLRKVVVQGAELSLTAREYEILYLLIQNPVKVYSRESLYELVCKRATTVQIILLMCILVTYGKKSKSMTLRKITFNPSTELDFDWRNLDTSLTIP